MQCRWLKCAGAPTLAAGLVSSLPAAASARGMIGTVPVLLAKSWFIGYALVFLAILLGMLAILIPSMRKKLRKK